MDKRSKHRTHSVPAALLGGALTVAAPSFAHAQASQPRTQTAPAARRGAQAPRAAQTPQGAQSTQTSQGAQASPAGQPAQVDAPASTLEHRVDDLLGRPAGLTSDQVARRAAATSYDALARRAEIAAAAAAVDQAWMGFLPRLSVTARYTRLSDIAPFAATFVATEAPGPVSSVNQLQGVPFNIAFPSNETLFQASLRIPLSDYVLRISQNYAAATHSQRAAQFTERATRLKAAFDGRVAYYNWVRARLNVLVAEQSLTNAQEQLADVQHAFQAGAMSQADVARVQAQAASAELLVTRSQNLAELSEDAVRIALHVPAGQPLAIGEDVRGDLPPIAVSTDLASAYDEALSNRLELRALGETAGSLHDQARVARAGAYPRLEAFGDATYANPNQRIFPPQEVFTGTWDLGVGLTWSPNDVPTSLAAARGADARAAQVDAQRNGMRDQLRAEVLAAISAVREADVAVRTTATGLAAAEESYRVRRVLFRNGRATSVELTDAETTLTRARLEALSARVDQRVARVRLLHATGHDANDAP